MSDAEPRPISVAELRTALSQACDMAGGQSAWARRHGVHRGVVAETLAGRRDPSPAVLNGLGLIRVERYIPIKRGSNV